MKQFLIVCFTLSLAFMLETSAATKNMSSSQKMAQDNGQITNPNKSILLSSKKATFTIQMKANPTTGFVWFLRKYDPYFIKPINHEYVAPKSAMPGAGGYEKWVFQGQPVGFVVPHITEITFIYARLWERDRGQSTSYRVAMYQ